MQVPERLALIGGSILLSSTLVFTLKSQASSIIPNVSHSISGVFNHIGDAQKSSNFDNGYQEAQQNHWTTGNWGSSKYYIDKDNNLHVGNGELQGTIFNTLGQEQANGIKSISIDQSVKAPKDSSGLFAQMSNITDISGLGNVDTSAISSISGMFANNGSLKTLDSGNLNVSSNITDISWVFNNDFSLTSLDLSSWDMSNAQGTYAFFSNDSSITTMTLGNNTKNTPLNDTKVYNYNWKNNNQVLSGNQLMDGNSHQGTWMTQSAIDQQQPNLAPVTSDSYSTGSNDRWDIPVQKGKTYYISTNVNSGYEAFETKNGPHTQFVGRDGGIFIAKFTSDRDGTMPIGFGYGDLGAGNININKLTITQSDSYVPFETAQHNKNNQ